MTNASDVFKATGDDLPPEIIKGLGERQVTRDRILGLFDLKEPLTAGEVSIGMFRLYGQVIQVAAVRAQLRTLDSQGRLYTVGRGIFRRQREEGEQA